MPEYFMHNHELLTGIGETPEEIFVNMGQYWRYLGGLILAGGFLLYVIGGHYTATGYYDPHDIVLKVSRNIKKEKLALQKDFFGSSRIRVNVRLYWCGW